MTGTLVTETAAVCDALRRMRPWVRTVTSVRRLGGGLSREIWAADATGDDRQESVVLRRDPPGIDQGPNWAALQTTKAAEIAAMAAARAVGVPVPEPWGLLTTADGLGEGIVMQEVRGETLGARILRDPELAQARTTLAAECGRALGRLHRGGLAAATTTELAAHEPVGQWRTQLDALSTRSPVLEYALRFLVEHAPEPRAPVLVHGDFRLGNLVVDARGLVAVLDWEAAHVGQAGEDLGWLCVAAFRSSRALEVGGFGAVEDLLAGYAETSGTTIGTTEFRYWQIFANLRWAVMTQMLADLHLSGVRPSLEFVLTGRERAGAQRDLVQLVLRALDLSVGAAR